MVRKSKLKRTKKRQVNKTLKKNVRKSMNKKVVKRYNKKTIKKQCGGFWNKKKNKKKKEKNFGLPDDEIDRLLMEQNDALSDVLVDPVRPAARHSTELLHTEGGPWQQVNQVEQVEQVDQVEQVEQVEPRTPSQPVACPLRLVYTHSGRIMCILYSLFSKNPNGIKQLVQIVEGEEEDKEGKFYNNCVIELLFNKEQTKYGLGVKLVVSGNISGKGGKRLCSEGDSKPESNLSYRCQEFETQQLDIPEGNIPKVIIEMLMDGHTRVMLIRHGEAEHNLSARDAKERKDDYKADEKPVQAGGMDWRRRTKQLALPVVYPTAAAVAAVGTVGTAAAGHGLMGIKRARNTDRGYIQDSDLTLDGIEPAESAAVILFKYLHSVVGYTDIYKLCDNLKTYVSMLKRTFHTAALFNGVLLLKYKEDGRLRPEEIPMGWGKLYEEPLLRKGVVGEGEKIKGLTYLNVKADLGEISSSQVKKATFKDTDKWGLGEMKYDDTKCAPADMKSKTGLVIKPHIYRSVMMAVDYHANNTPCSKYKKVQFVVLEKYKGEKYVRNNKCEMSRFSAKFASPVNKISQFTNIEALNGLTFTLDKTVNQVAEDVEHAATGLKGGYKRKLKTKKRKTKNIRK